MTLDKKEFMVLTLSLPASMLLLVDYDKRMAINHFILPVRATAARYSQRSL
jgi:hypothetical protein